MNCRENGIYGAKGSSTEIHKFSNALKPNGEKIFKAYFNILHEME